MARKKQEDPGLIPSDPDSRAVLENGSARAVAGVDTASDRLHVVSSTGLVMGYNCPKVKDPDPDDRRHQLFDQATAMFGLLPAGTLLVVEEPLALQNGKTTRLLGMAAGAIWAAHLTYPVFWAWVNVSTWKKQTVGNGNATKDAVEAWVQQELGETYDAEDFYDAAAIRHYGQKVLGQV